MSQAATIGWKDRATTWKLFLKLFLFFLNNKLHIFLAESLKTSFKVIPALKLYSQLILQFMYKFEVVL